MKKKVKVNNLNQEIELLSHGGIPILYNSIFMSDFFEDYDEVVDYQQQAVTYTLDVLEVTKSEDLTEEEKEEKIGEITDKYEIEKKYLNSLIIYQIIYTLVRANDDEVEPFETYFNQFEEFSFSDVWNEASNLISDSMKRISKKK